MKIRHSIHLLMLMAACLPAHSDDKAPQGHAVAPGQPLQQFLAGTRWYWLGGKDHILELRKDGKAQLDYWKLPTDWKVTGPSQVTFTMHFKGEDKTAVITFAEDRSSFTGIQFNKTSVISRSPRAPDDSGGGEPLQVILPGTKWYWLGSKDHILELRKDGKANLDFWTLPTDWKITGPSEVTFTMHFKAGTKTAIINFTDDRSSFTGVQFNKTSVISRSPRALH